MYKIADSLDEIPLQWRFPIMVERIRDILNPTELSLNMVRFGFQQLKDSFIHQLMKWKDAPSIYFYFNEFLHRLYFVIYIANKLRRTLCILFNQSVRNDAHNETYYQMWNRLHIEKKITRNTTSKVSIILNHLHSSKLDVFK